MAPFNNERYLKGANVDSREPTHGSLSQCQHSPNAGHHTVRRFNIRCFRQWSPNCLQIANNSPTRRGGLLGWPRPLRELNPGPPDSWCKKSGGARPYPLCDEYGHYALCHLQNKSIFWCLVDITAVSILLLCLFNK